MSKLKQLAVRLKEKDKLYFQVKNNETGNIIDRARNIDQKYLNEHCEGDISVFIKTLLDDGFTSITIQPRVPNGNSFRASGNEFVIPLKPKTTPGPVEAPRVGLGSINKNTPPSNGSMSYEMLTYILGEREKQILLLEKQIEEISEKSKKRKKAANDLQIENNLLKTEGREQQAEIDKLSGITGKITQGLNSPAGEIFIEKTAPIVQNILTSVVSKFMEASNKGASNKIQDVAPLENLTDIQIEVIEKVKKSHQDVNEVMWDCLEKIHTNEGNFANDLVTLVNKYNEQPQAPTPPTSTESTTPPNQSN